MGSSFFKAGGQPKVIAGGPKIGGVGQNMEARAIGSSIYGARGAAAGAMRSLGEARAAGKAGAKSLKRSAAYPKGPKI